MARPRRAAITLREPYLSSPTLHRISREAHLHYHRILLCADVWGCFDLSPRRIIGLCYPVEEYWHDIESSTVRGWLSEYRSADLLEVWTDDGRAYGFWRSWFTWNRYPRRGYKRTTPVPPSQAGTVYDVTESNGGDVTNGNGGGGREPFPWIRRVAENLGQALEIPPGLHGEIRKLEAHRKNDPGTLPEVLAWALKVKANRMHPDHRYYHRLDLRQFVGQYDIIENKAAAELAAQTQENPNAKRNPTPKGQRTAGPRRDHDDPPGRSGG